ncbi:MAG: disulfide bond formation protein B [Alphaproteobacteria bacterium]|nr:MAG: disulfide bond formation protein B [Alphaproteobacteria bacterium]
MTEPMLQLKDLIHRAQSLTDRQIFVLMIAVSALTLATAHGFESFANLPPCPLCLDQRETYWAAITFSFLGVAADHLEKTKATWLPWILLVCVTASFGYGAYLAGYHAGVEYKWWAGPASCTVSGAAMSIEAMLALENSDVVLCDEIPWSLFGISMAGYNFLIATTLTLISGAALLRNTKARRAT